MPTFDRPTMQARYWEAKAEKEALEAALSPALAAREELVARIQALEAELAPINRQINDGRGPIVDLANEMGAIAKFLTDADGKARLGEPPAAA